MVVSPVLGLPRTSDQWGLRALLQRSRHELPRLHHLWVDQGYRGVAFIAAMLLSFGVVLDVVGGDKKQKGFCLQARRWVVERSLAWYGNYRRLARDYEVLPESSETFIYLASCDLMLKRLAGTSCPAWQ